MILNATKLGTYDKIKHKIIDSGRMKDGRACQFVASVFAGFAMTCTTTAFDNMKTRLMNNPDKYSGLRDCAKKMYAEGGYPMFLRGFGPQWARFAPFTTIQLLSWEAMRKFGGFKGV